MLERTVMVACGLLAIALNLSVPAEAQTYEFKLTGTVVTSTNVDKDDANCPGG
jgi:hypothetical protein